MSLKKLRAEQAKAVMPLIGNLLDQFESIPNDLLSSLEEEAEGLVEALREIQSAMEGE
jgi:hypothetical protein